jgi:Txe/YoeB family toxin of toxin-antitoxin system
VTALNGEFQIFITKAAQKDKEKIKVNPFQNPPPYERLLGNLNSCYSRRINVQHRLVYTVDEENKIIKIISMWTHYEF